MKKVTLTVISAVLACGLAFAFAGCGGENDETHTITVGASQTPHAEILEEIKDDLKAQGYELVIRVFDDYILPNTALEEGSLDANYFQHTPYLNTFNKEHSTHLVSAGKIHYEPFGVYGKKVTKEDYASVKTGRTILIPNDGSNMTRALFVLQDEGYITLREGATAEETLTEHDIVEANGNSVRPVQAENVSQLLKESEDGTIAVINGNYALQAGLNSADALAFENASGDAAQLYANIIAVREGSEQSEKTKALLAALKTQKVHDFITTNYHGAVLPVFSV